MHSANVAVRPYLKLSITLNFRLNFSLRPNLHHEVKFGLNSGLRPNFGLSHYYRLIIVHSS